MNALKALEMMQALLSDSLDAEFSENEKYEAVNATETMAELEAESSDSKEEETVTVLAGPFWSKKIWGSLRTKINLLTALMQMHHNPCEVRMDYSGCWLSYLNVCKVAWSSKTR